MVESAIFAYLLAGIIAYAGYRAGSLTTDGAVAACLVGGTVLGIGGLPWALLLVFFFVSSSALSYVKSSDERKRTAAETFEKGGRRDAAQVLANGGVAALFALLSPFVAEPLLFSAYVGALGAATADTWATEVGVLSSRQPRLITNGRAVPAGTSGGISPLGTLASSAGAVSIGLAAIFLAILPIFGLSEAILAKAPVLLISGFLGGLAGSLGDSVLGATVQAAYFCPQCQVPTESRTHKCGAKTERRRGFSSVKNDLVNLLATAIGASAGALVWLVL